LKDLLDGGRRMTTRNSGKRGEKQRKGENWKKMVVRESLSSPPAGNKERGERESSLSVALPSQEILGWGERGTSCFFSFPCFTLFHRG
jgi:hypothetical protein